MSTYSSLEFENLHPIPIRALEYRDMGHGAVFPQIDTRDPREERPRETEVENSESELTQRIKQERTDAIAQTEQKLRQEYEIKLQAGRSRINAAISGFDAQRTEYFARVEAEIVQLSLAIAAKILHREAQVDPMLVATLVRIAVEKMREGSKVTVRVGPSRFAQWKAYFASQPSVSRVEVVENAELSEHDCLLETELGATNFGLDTQLKEVEHGFFDLLALRPGAR
ncbi:MAG: FliH/SctL family protein [Terracidiphilus sp.]|jgi:flagellar assembly protein FliH